MAAHDVTVPAEAATGRVIAALAGELICLAHRRCDVILVMLCDRKPYQPDRAKAAEAA